MALLRFFYHFNFFIQMNKTKENESLSVFQYQGKDITFQLGNGDVMVNATEMAKPFGKRVAKWLELPSTKNFIKALSENRTLAENQFITSIKGGINPSARGNWLHEDLALEFARWLSPAFAIWCNDRIKELLKYGMTATNETIEQIVCSPDFGIAILTKLKEEREKNQLLQEQNREQQQQIEEDRPKVKFASSVEASSGSILISELAKLIKQNGIDIGQNRLFKWLRENKYLCSKGEYKNKPTQKSMQEGLFEIKRTVIKKDGKEPLVFSTTKVTGKGQIYFVNRFLSDKKSAE